MFVKYKDLVGFENLLGSRTPKKIVAPKISATSPFLDISHKIKTPALTHQSAITLNPPFTRIGFESNSKFIVFNATLPLLLAPISISTGLK